MSKPGADLDRLVIRWWAMTRSLARQWDLPGYDVDDVEQEALIALLEAARNFDPHRGVKFSTFATHVIELRLAGVAEKALRQKHRPLNEAVVVVTRHGKAKAMLELIADRAPQPDQVVIARERIEIAIRVVNEEMTSAERTAIVGVLNERDYLDIAGDMMVPAGFRYVDNAVQRARRKLRDSL